MLLDGSCNFVALNEEGSVSSRVSCRAVIWLRLKESLIQARCVRMVRFTSRFMAIVVSSQCIRVYKGAGLMLFHVTIEKDEDGWMVAECPALPGCLSQGIDEQEALVNIKEAIEAWLWAEDMKQLEISNASGKVPLLVSV